MKKQLADHLPLPERKQFLLDNCDASEKMSYMKKFAPDEIVLFKDRLSGVSIEINDLEEKKKDVNKGFSAELDPLKIEKKGLLSNIKQKAILVKEECFKFIDHENEIVEFYNMIGEMIEQRGIYPHERQKTIFNLKEGANK